MSVTPGKEMFYHCTRRLYYQTPLQMFSIEDLTIFADPCFKILHYRDSEEDIFVAIKAREEDGTLIFPGMSLRDIINLHIKPALREILEKDIEGYFDPIHSFHTSEKHILLNTQCDLAVCNI